jgi:hypothetical protein
MYNTVVERTQWRGVDRLVARGHATGGGRREYVQGMKKERATYVVCDQCQNLFKAGTFKDGTTPTACPPCRVGVDPAGQTVTIDTESRF